MTLTPTLPHMRGLNQQIWKPNSSSSPAAKSSSLWCSPFQARDVTLEMMVISSSEMTPVNIQSHLHKELALVQLPSLLEVGKQVPSAPPRDL